MEKDKCRPILRPAVADMKLHPGYRQHVAGRVEISGFEFPSRFIRGPEPYAETDQRDQGYQRNGNQQLHLNRLVCSWMRFITSDIGCYKTSRKDRVIVEA